MLGGDGTCSADGADPIGDFSSSSGSTPTDDPTAMATDIVKVSHRQLDATTHEFTGHLAGGGIGVATDKETDFYQVSVRGDGWDATIGYYNGLLEPGTVLSRSVDNGEATTTRLAGATVEIEWVSDDKYVITVSNLEDGQTIDHFVLATSTRAVSDEATCHAVCETD